MYNHLPMTLPVTNEWGFDLLLENTEDGYRAGVLQSPAGEAWASFSLPFEPREQHAFVQQLLADPGKDERMPRRPISAGAQGRRPPV